MVREVRFLHIDRRLQPFAFGSNTPSLVFQADNRTIAEMTTYFVPEEGDRIIGHCLFTDGVRRPVFQDLAGQQYVVEEGERIDGVWLDTEIAH